MYHISVDVIGTCDILLVLELFVASDFLPKSSSDWLIDYGHNFPITCITLILES